MDMVTVSMMNAHLRQVLTTTSDWDDDQLGDEDIYTQNKKPSFLQTKFENCYRKKKDYHFTFGHRI
jgi:hypothetical protein